MNKTLIMLLMVLGAVNASLFYTLDVDRSGSVSVTLSIQQDGNASLVLPSDASALQIVGGSYKVVDGTALISAGKTGFTTFSFTSDLLTTKSGSGWKLVASPPEDSLVRIYAPSYSVIGKSSPEPTSVSSDGYRNLMEFAYSPAIRLEYRLEDVPPASEESIPAPYLIAAFVLLIVAIGYVLYPRAGIRTQTPPVSLKPVEKQPTLSMTPGKKEMMETFNDNDTRIVNFLLANKGKSRRNELERKTGISKSSLSMALNRLEKRKIVEMDRTSTTHFVKLSDYFLKL